MADRGRVNGVLIPGYLFSVGFVMCKGARLDFVGASIRVQDGLFISPFAKCVTQLGSK
jgi:hypothetical protein